MKQCKYNLALCFITLIFFGNISAQKTINVLQKVIIIRHGEKPESGNNLSCQGLNRAMELPEVLYAKIKTPDYIFVPALKEGKSTRESRMFETIVPYAVKYNLDVNTRYDVKDAAGLAGAILKKNGTVLVVWEHNNILNIVRALGIKDDTLKWKDSDYDSIWIITFQNGKAVLTSDKENLNPSAACK